MNVRFSLYGLILFISMLCACDGSLPSLNEEFCWTLVDQYGSNIGQKCNKSEKQMKSDYPDPCSYYKLGKNGCWLTEQKTLYRNVPEGLIDYLVQCKRITQPIKVNCEDCQVWLTREKHLSKRDNAMFFRSIRDFGYCGDTLTKLYNGREIVLRETSDSLITLQFLNQAK